MNIKIRRGVFETNSSTSHSITFREGMSADEAQKYCDETGNPCLMTAWGKLCFLIGSFYEAMDTLEFEIYQAEKDKEMESAEIEAFRTKNCTHIVELLMLADECVKEYGRQTDESYDEIMEALNKEATGKLLNLREGQFEFFHYIINESNFAEYDDILKLLNLTYVNEEVAIVTAKRLMDKNFQIINDLGA